MKELKAYIENRIKELKEAREETFVAKHLGLEIDCMVDELEKVLAKLNEQSNPQRIWRNIDEEKPHCYQTGNWDGKRSDEVLVQTGHLTYTVAVMYSGFLDGSEFNDFYDKSDLEVGNVTHWMPIPDINEQSTNQD